LSRQTYETATVWLLFVIAICTMTNKGAAQRTPCRVVFVDKGPEAFQPGSVLYEKTLTTFNERSLERRRRAGMNPVLDTLDQPLYAVYVANVVRVSDSLLAVLPWFNAIVVGLSDAEQNIIQSQAGVRLVVPTSTVSYSLTQPDNCDPASYGFSEFQQTVAGTRLLHNAGVYGSGVRVGVIDNGFRWNSMSSLKHLNVLAEFDAIYKDSITSNEPIDTAKQDEHGSFVLSILAGWQHDSLIGIAPFGSFLLAKSEDMRYERRIEEDLYAESLMWLERQGADLSTSSVGYRKFDSTDVSTPYADMDGKTAYASRAINIATGRGMTCITAAGNSGPVKESIIVPADADSAITVGALATDGISAWQFSSWGPTADGKIKPDFVAPGMDVYGQTVNGDFKASSGTSLATPIVAGQVALLLELYPHTQPWVLREALRKASTLVVRKDSVLGYGSIDVTRAAQLMGPGVGPPTIITLDSKRTIFASVFSEGTIDVHLIIRDPITGQKNDVVGIRSEEPWYLFSIEPAMLYRDTMQARIVATMINGTRVGQFPRDSTWFALPRNSVVKPCGVRLPGSVTSVALERAIEPGPCLVNAPLDEGARCFTVAGIDQAPSDVRIVHIGTGTLVECSVSYVETSMLTVNVTKGLARGAYLIVLRSDSGSRSLPLIVR